ncbi:MAG: hypothetical protein CMM46_02800 [Rhodospirillaceae bacterium]|nr:hypothetical protein [Rhodospirillaceae bacterium]|tara:strand:+ start:1177 stop:2088 length:912 start_codon:yes stop_codon:yes gene_type:complete
MTGSIIVTGTAGFIGSWVAKQLLELGWSVTAFDREADDRKLRANAGDEAASRVTWHAGDIANPDTVKALFEAARPDRVIHLAAVLIPVCRDTPVTGALIDVIGHINIFEAAHAVGCDQVVYASSAAATARRGDGTLTTVYGSYKRWCEEFSAVRHHERGTHSIGLRPAIVYGPGREAGATAFVNAAITEAVAGREHTLPTRWNHRVEHVEEVADAFVRCATTPIEGAHASDITTTNTNDEDFLAALRQAIPDCRVDPADSESFREAAPADTSVLEGLIGPLHGISLEEGVARTVAAMRQSGGS